MHHEKRISNELLEALAAEEKKHQIARDFGGLVPVAEDQAPGPTGNMPDEKLTPNDEGEIKMRVAVYKGKVILDFGTPVASIGMTVKQARYLANALWNQAHRTSLEEKAFQEQERKEKAAGRRRH